MKLQFAQNNIFHSLEANIKRIVLPFIFIEMITQNIIYEIGLRHFVPVGCTFNKHLVLVRNNELLVLIRVSPGTDVAVQGASLAGAAFDVVALLAEGLPVPEIIGAISRTGNFMIGTELDIWVLRPAGGAFVAVSFLEFSPVGGAQFCSGFSFLADVETLKLVTATLLCNGGKAFFSLQLAHTTEDIFVSSFSTSGSKDINSGSNVLFCQNWSRDAMCRRPKRLQNYRVIEFVSSARRYESRSRFHEPSLPTSFGFVWGCSRREEKTLACTRFSHWKGRS